MLLGAFMGLRQLVRCGPSTGTKRRLEVAPNHVFTEWG